MTRLFNRNVSVTVWRMSSPPATQFNPRPLGAGEQLEITDLRVKFHIRRDFSRHPNNADVEIYNLSAETRADLQTRPLRVQLSAGYDGENRLLTTGDVLFSMSKQDGTAGHAIGVDWVTLLQLQDGGRTFGGSRVNKQYAPGTTYRQIIRDVARSMGLQIPPALEKNPKLDQQFFAGASLSGSAADELSRLLSPFGYQWSIQNNVLRVLGDGEVVNKGQALVIGEEQGMIGTPEFGSPPKSNKPPHMTVKMLLYPELVPGDLIQLNSKAKSGNFKLIKVEHKGDTGSTEWITEVEIQPL